MPKSTMKRVPAALHSELSEYASLLRALRTGATLDLAAQLVKPGGGEPLSSRGVDDDDEQDGTESDEDDDEDDEDEVVDQLASGEDEVDAQDQDRPYARHPNTEPKSLKRKRSRTETATAQTQTHPGTRARTRTPADRDTWTRWPLLAADVHAPEWALEDEVAHVAKEVRRERRRLWAERVREEQEQVQEAEGDQEEGQVEGEELVGESDASSAEDEDVGSDSDSDSDSSTSSLTPAHHALALATTHHLRALLTLCAAPIPRVSHSLRGRLAPLDWAGVLAAAAAGGTGIVTPESLARVRERLEAIYGEYHYVAEEKQGRSSLSVEGKRVDKGKGKAGVFNTALSPDQIAPMDFAAFPTTALASTVAARTQLREMYRVRRDEGDGDVLAFRGPRLVEDEVPKVPKRRHRKKEKLAT